MKFEMKQYPDVLLNEVPVLKQEVISKVDIAKTNLGDKYLLHPSNKVERLTPFTFTPEKFFEQVRKGF